jgi:hypothetical protein
VIGDEPELEKEEAILAPGDDQARAGGDEEYADGEDTNGNKSATAVVTTQGAAYHQIVASSEAGHTF